MQKTTLFLLCFIASISFAQTTDKEQPTNSKKFFIGLGIGAGTLHLRANDTSQTTFSTTIPNIKVGYRFNNRFALLALLPGANYKYHQKDRGFEAFILAGQWWVTPKWWLLGGSGLTFDAPAFYTVKDPKTAGFYTGAPAFTFATGYEIIKIKHCSIDLQYRLFYGKSHIQNNGTREGIANMFILGFNW